MKKSVYLVLIVFALLFVGVLPVYAAGHGHGGHGGHGHGHFFFGGDIFIGPGWGGWGPWWGAPYYPYYPNYPYYSPQQSSEYVEQTPQVEEQTYWYFCPDAKNYYPYVKRCPSGWLKVVPSSAPPDGSE